MIKAIAFDYGGVIEITERNLFQEIAKYLQINIEDLERVYFSLNHLCNTENKTSEEVIEMTVREFGADETQVENIKNLSRENNKTKKLNQELIDIIKFLKSKSYKIGLLSNNVVELRKKLIKQGIFDLFDNVIISAEAGSQKPDPIFFKYAFSELGVESNEVIFIDDTKRSLEGAESIGYVPILYTTNEKLKQDFLIYNITI